MTPRRGGAKQKRGMTWAAVCKAGLALPGVEEGTSYGTPALHVRKKFLARLREDQETIVIKCGFDERDLRLQADQDTFFITDHYRGYPTVLVRLAEVTPDVLREVMEQAWRVNAPARMVKEYDAR